MAYGPLNDAEQLRSALGYFETLAWIAVIGATMSLFFFKRPPRKKSRISTKEMRAAMHGRWFEVAGIHNWVDRGFRSALNSDTTRSNMTFQVINTGTEFMDFAVTNANGVEAGRTYQTVYGWLRVVKEENWEVLMSVLAGSLLFSFPVTMLHMNKDRDMIIWGSPTEKVVYVLSKNPTPSREKMIKTLEALVDLGFSLKNLKPFKQSPTPQKRFVLLTVRRYGILNTTESRPGSEPERHLHPMDTHQKYPGGIGPDAPGLRSGAFSPVSSSDGQGPGPLLEPDSRQLLDYVISSGSKMLVSPNIFRTVVDKDVKKQTMDRFFDGCVRGDLRFVADFVDREFLWTTARNEPSFWSGLHYAAYNGYPELVTYFLRRDSNSNARSVRRETPLMLAVVGLIRHIEERLRWDDGRSCVYDLEEGDGFYSHKPHSLERYEETVRILLRYDSCLASHKSVLGVNPQEVLAEAERNLEDAIASHPNVSSYVRKYIRRVQRRMRWADLLAMQPIMLTTHIQRLIGVFLWIFVRISTGMLRITLKVLDAIFLATGFVVAGAVYWVFFRWAGRALIYARLWVPIERRRDEAANFDGDCALLIVLSLESPIVTKLGQLLSGRVDLIPEPVARRLSLLQSHAPPMPPREVESALSICYGENYRHLFEEFDLVPMAVGTVAQVHRAKLANSGEIVAVKVVKRGMREDLARYLFLLHGLSRFGLFGTSKVARFRVQRISMLFLHQTDMNLEAASIHAMQRHAWRHLERNVDPLHVAEFPRVHSLLTMENILVMDNIENRVPLWDFIAKPTIPLKVMFTRLGRIFMRNVFLDGLLHCDLHPGNIMVRPEDGRIVLLDFGIIGELAETDRAALTAFNLACITGETDLAIAIFLQNFVQDVGKEFVDPDRKAAFAEHSRPIFEAHFGEAGPWDMAGFSSHFQQAMKDFDIALTSAWAIVEMGILHFRSTLAILERDNTLKDVLWQLLYSEHAALLDSLSGTTYYAALEDPVRRKFGWGAVFKKGHRSESSSAGSAGYASWIE